MLKNNFQFPGHANILPRAGHKDTLAQLKASKWYSSTFHSSPFNVFCVCVWLDKGDYLENLHSAFCPNKQHSSELFMCLGPFSRSKYRRQTITYPGDRCRCSCWWGHYTVRHSCKDYFHTHWYQRHMLNPQSLHSNTTHSHISKIRANLVTPGMTSDHHYLPVHTASFCGGGGGWVEGVLIQGWMVQGLQIHRRAK